MRFATIAVSAYALAASLAGTEVRAQDHSHEAGQEHPLVIEVNMADHSFSPEALRIPAGRPVQLVFMNTGEVEHEFMAGRTVADGDFEVDLFAGLDVEIRTEEAEEAEHGHEEAAEGHDDDDAEHHDNADGHHGDGGDHGTMVLLEEGGRASMTFTLPVELRGEWEMACFVTGHYRRGMHGTVSVY